jgi:hypothetical protein
MGREDGDRDAGLRRPEPGDCRQAVLAVDLDVEQDDVRARRDGRGDAVGDRGRHADAGDVGLGGQGERQKIGEGGVVVDDQHLQHVGATARPVGRLGHHTLRPRPRSRAAHGNSAPAA